MMENMKLIDSVFMYSLNCMMMGHWDWPGFHPT